jgi:hypothetical protein
MRLPTARPLARTLALTLALAAAAAPAAAQTSFTPAPTASVATTPAAAAAWAGVFRIDVAKGDEVLPMRVVVERAGAGLDGTVLLGGTASALANVRFEAGELRATMVTSSGKGELVLRQTETGVTGTLKIGKTTWSVSGERSA